MTKIYTKTGDAGETSLLRGERVTKDCVTIRVVGELDELSCVLGIARACARPIPAGDLAARIEKIQADLLRLGAEVAAAQRESVAAANKISLAEVEDLEKQIDEMSTDLPELKNFILPGSGEADAYLHLARAVCRRAERELVALGKDAPVRAEAFAYLNRLSDWLFTAARYGGQV